MPNNNHSYPRIYPDLVWSERLSEYQEAYRIYPRKGAVSFQTTQDHIRSRYPIIVSSFEEAGELEDTKEWIKFIRLMYQNGLRF